VEGEEVGLEVGCLVGPGAGAPAGPGVGTAVLGEALGLPALAVGRGVACKVGLEEGLLVG